MLCNPVEVHRRFREMHCLCRLILAGFFSVFLLNSKDGGSTPLRGVGGPHELTALLSGTQQFLNILTSHLDIFCLKHRWESKQTNALSHWTHLLPYGCVFNEWCVVKNALDKEYPCDSLLGYDHVSSARRLPTLRMKVFLLPTVKIKEMCSSETSIIILL